MTDARVTRGKTRAGRLRLADAWLVATQRDLLARTDAHWRGAPVVDLGLGSLPHTTVELAEAVQDLAPVPVVGVDVAPRRVAYASRTAARPGLRFVEGGFDLGGAGPARLVRAMNLLRQYRPAQAARARDTLGEQLLEGGVLLEGSSDGPGAVLAAWILRRVDGALVREGLLLATDLSRGFAPAMFRDWLPRGDRDDPEAIALLDGWQAAWAEVRAAGIEDNATRWALSAAAVPSLDAVAEGVVVARP